jgi:signal transduction histidine kinase
MAQNLTGATGAAFLLFDEPRMRVDVGGERSPDDEKLHALAIVLAEGLHVKSKVSDDSLPEYAAWLAAPIRIEQSLVGVFWLSFAESFQVTKTNRPILTSLVDGLTVVAMNAQVQERHEDSHQLTVSVLNSITDPLLVVDGDRKVLLMNPAAEAIFNMPTANAQGKLLREIVQSDSLVKYAEDENGTLEEWTTDDGKTFVPRMEAVYDADGPIEGWVLALRDVTRFKQLNRNQSEFMRIVSHDLRSPLTSMQGFASMLELGLVGELNEKQAHFVEKILSGITQMTSLVDNIQDAGRFDPETGFYELARSQCDLGEMVSRIVENHLVPAEKQELTISASIGEDVPIINADTNMLERAVINLVDNAIKYTPNGGKIEVAVKRRNDEVVVSVSDNGLGISPENQQHVFDRHVRIPRK